jgi:nitroimidazol reductase NimA-like FMN-containing flavoprotein (pyridoxamine 5'-phosphate oxidase superfamily)
MNYVVKNGVFYMTSYGKAQKVLNVRRNPKVGLMVETGDSYAELRGVMVRGHCEIIEDPEAVRRSRSGRRRGTPGHPRPERSRARRSGWCSRSSRAG